jgi:hypothetical protein
VAHSGEARLDQPARTRSTARVARPPRTLVLRPIRAITPFPQLPRTGGCWTPRPRCSLTGERTGGLTIRRSYPSSEPRLSAKSGPSPILAVTSAVIALIRRVDLSRIVAVSNARPDTSDATAGAISSLWHFGRVRTPSLRTLKVGSRTEDRRRRQSSPHAVGNVPRRPTQGRSTRAPTLPFLAVVASGRLSLPPSQRSSPSES